MLVWRIALRYLFSAKSHSVINTITLVAAVGVTVIAAALFCTLSVYNGFESLVDSLTSQFDPDWRIEAKEGKTFHTDAAMLESLQGVGRVSEVLEEDVLLVYGDRQIAARLKGVDSVFWQREEAQRMLVAGEASTDNEDAVIGIGLALHLGMNAGFVRPLTVYCPRRGAKVSVLNPEAALGSGDLYASGVFAVEQAEYDDNVIICSIEFARTLLGGDATLASAYEVWAADGDVRNHIENSVGGKFSVLSRRELHADAYRIMCIEKWITYLIIVFILLIASFSVVGALTMLIIDKEPQTATLRALGASDDMVRRIFVCEGWLISGVGGVVGIAVGLALCLAQQHFGLIRLADDTSMYVVDAYPVVVRWMDVVWTLAGVGVVGLLAAVYPTRSLRSLS